MLKFFKCEVCKNIIVKLADSGVSVSCCGKPMKELVPGAVDGALEKHVPAVTVEGKNVKVQIGEVLHPMLEEHFIQFIALETKNGFQVKYLKAGDEPKAEFTVAADDEAVAVYEYCNLHGLWVKELA
ncbi:MAG: desulfoferrodoxin Dfx [Oscillospiraceae bacterium]|nr:desulfoferrodoxin Dfx [Oscillospiraceae bacterium]MBR3536192.1 desulfoferrodoxin Dfx [Oscillospiraceae bacterium]MBR6835367.1 desulfoferrodoxin Dfx [Oscillospiraceae bacterium]